ncbi:MAG: lamin tail domain-containing protein, partial [Phycisphaerales bacterium]
PLRKITDLNRVLPRNQRRLQGHRAVTLQSSLVPGQDTVEVSDLAEGDADAVTVYRMVDGEPADVLGTVTNPATDPVTVDVTPLVDGHEIAATQTIGGVEGPTSAVETVSIAAPTILGSYDAGDTLVTVTGLHPLAQLVTVYVDNDTYPESTGGAPTVDVTVPPLIANVALRATQTIGGVEGPFSPTVVVANYVVVNEFSYDDSGDDNHEFVELYNNSSDPIDIGDYVIQVGDYIEGQTPPGVYTQIFIPPGTTIAGHGYWTVADPQVGTFPGAVIDMTYNEPDWLENGQNYIALRNSAGVLLDAVGWELNKGYTFIPDELNTTQLGTGIWGNHVHPDDPPTSQSRFLDGLDTDNNGRDFGIQPATPGYSNNQPDQMPYLEDCSGLTAGAVVPNWVFSYKPLIACDPAVVDSFGENGWPINPAAIPASPDGGNVIVGWDEVGGGNANYMAQLAKEDFTLETYIYVAPEYTNNGYEETKIGVRGMCDGVHNFDYYNGATGLCWFLQRGSSWQTLYLLDENDGNDGTSTTPICAGTIFQTIPIGVSPSMTGWQRLLLEVKGDQVLGIFGGTYGSRSDGIQVTGTHDSPGPGGVYISYREAIAGAGEYPAQPYNRPPTLDAFSLTAPPIDGDIDLDGDVDLGDLVKFVDCLAGPNVGTPPAPCTSGEFDRSDLEHDSDVDLGDFAEFQVLYE